MSKHQEIVENLYKKYFNEVGQDSILFYICQQGGKAYDEIYRLNCEAGYWQPDKGFDSKLVYYMAEWLKRNIRNNFVETMSVEVLAGVISNQILGYYDRMKEIQQLQEQLARISTTTTTAVELEIKRNSILKARLRNAFKEGGIDTLKLLFSPLGIPTEVARSWIETE
ncbi:MAG TPA: hypothetical protein DC064_04390 [Cyanobacteria bacterium UBA9273]|nr:hypothetical protein [Cyanobacteria bacterium UBA9273]